MKVPGSYKQTDSNTSESKASSLNRRAVTVQLQKFVQQILQSLYKREGRLHGARRKHVIEQSYGF